MSNKKNHFGNIVIVIIAIVFIYILFVLSQSASKEDKNAALRDKLIKDKDRVRRKINELKDKHTIVKRERKVHGLLGGKINSKAKMFAITLLMSMSLLVLTLVIYLAYVLADGNNVIVIITATISFLIALKYLFGVIPAILRVNSITLREIGNYFEEKRLKRLYKKYHYNPLNLDALVNEELSLKDQIELLLKELKMIESSIAELDEN